MHLYTQAKKYKVLLEKQSPEENTLFLNPQLDTSLHCKTTDTGLLYLMMCLFTTQFLLTSIAPTHGLCCPESYTTISKYWPYWSHIIHYSNSTVCFVNIKCPEKHWSMIWPCLTADEYLSVSNIVTATSSSIICSRHWTSQHSGCNINTHTHSRGYLHTCIEGSSQPKYHAFNRNIQLS